MEALYQACCELPPDLKKVRALLEAKQFTSEQLTRIGLRFVQEKCRWEADAYRCETIHEPQDHEMHSACLHDVLKLLLEFGLDPNLILDDETIMDAVFFVDYQFAAADCLRVLMENGGDPNMKIDGESLFEHVDFDVIFWVGDINPLQYEQLVHMWFVLLGYGGHPDNTMEPVRMSPGHQLTELREHERYDFSIEYTKAVKDGWIMHIFCKDSGEEVATL